MSSFEHVTSRLGNVKSETRSIAKEVFEAAQKAGHEIWFMWGMGGPPEHSTGLALDWMVRTKEAGDFVRNFLWTHRKRLRLKHVIWRQHITSTVVRPGQVVKMADRGNATANHFDHVHSLCFPGEYQKWVTPPPAPKPAPVKSVDQLASEVLAGRWGNGDDRKNRLTKAGHNYAAVQARVNEKLKQKNRKTVSQLATEVIQGKWGNGADRRTRLIKAGYNYDAVQAEVNKRV